MKVLHILQSQHFSGAENVVCQIISMMRDDPSMESVYCSCDGTIRNALEERKIKFSPISRLSIKEVRRVIQQEKPDLIHAHDRTASLIAALCCGRIPYVSHIHYNAVNTRSISAKALGYLIAAFKAKHIFWVSQSSYDGYIFHKILKSKSTILYNIIDVSALYQKMRLDSKTYNYDIIFLGRLVDQKDPLRLLDVCKLVGEKVENLKVAIVGTGELENEMKEKVSELAMNQNIFFLGFQENPLKILHDSKVMLMTSRYEGTPMCALEALALGVPIVSTPADGMKVLIEDGKNGLLSNEDDKLARELVKIIESPSLRKEMSERAKKYSEKYNDIDRYRKNILNVYRKYSRK